MLQEMNMSVLYGEKLLNKFIGRGEDNVKIILQRLFPHSVIKIQIPIQSLIRNEDYNFLDQEIKNHKFDLVMYNGPHTLVIEVNYKHGDKAAKKWTNIFVPLLKHHEYDVMTVDDYDCVNIFKDHYKPTYLDVIDMVMAFKKAKIKIG